MTNNTINTINTINTNSINDTNGFTPTEVQNAIDNGNIPTLGELLSRPRIKTPTPFTLEGYCESGKGSVIPCFPWDYWIGFPISYELFMRLGKETAQRYVDTFGEDLIREVVCTLNWHDFVTTDNVEERNLPWMLLTLGGVLVDNRRITFTVKRQRGEWVKEEEVTGFKVMTLSSYRTWEKKLLNYCMVKKFPYLSQFDVAYYNWEGEDKTEFYLHVDEEPSHSLYCPFMAFKNNDFSLIVKRQTEYFTDYYKWPGGWGKEITEEKVLGWREENINLIHSKKAQELKHILDLNAAQGFLNMESQDYTQTLEYKEKIDDLTPRDVKKIDIMKQRYVIYGVSNGLPTPPTTFKTFKQALKNLTFMFSMLNQLGNQFYRDVIAEYPDNFTVNEDIGKAIMHLHNDAFNLMYEIDIINI